jgi:hypothetical protein
LLGALLNNIEIGVYLEKGKGSALDDKTANLFFLCHKSEILGACHESREEELKQYCIGFDTLKI